MGLSLQLFKAAFFRALAHPIRIRILEALGTGERSVQELRQALGLEQPIVSQQLAILRGKNIVTPPKLGTALRYALSDPLLTKLLPVTQEFFNDHLIDRQTMLREFPSQISAFEFAVLAVRRAEQLRRGCVPRVPRRSQVRGDRAAGGDCRESRESG